MRYKGLLTALFCFLFSAISFAQSSWLWAETVASTSGPWTVPNTAFSASSDSAGNVFVTGYFQNNTITFGSTTLTNADASGITRDIFIAKYDSAGNILWARRAGGGNSDQAHSIHADAAGNVYVTGMFSSPTITFGSTTLTNNSAGSYDLFLVKLNANGVPIWARSAGGALLDQSDAVDTDNSGNVFITGAFMDTIVFGATTLTGVWDIFLTKYDANGNVLWARSADGPTAHDEGYSVSTDSYGNIFIAGEFQSDTLLFGSTTLVNSGYRDIFVAKYDGTGNLLWARTTDGGIEDDAAYSVSTDTSGNAYVTGYFGSASLTFGSSLLTNTNTGGYRDVFIAKYDSNGNVLWAKSGGGPRQDHGYSISVKPDENVLVTGGFQDSIRFGSTLLIEPTGGNLLPIFILEFDANGNILCGDQLADGTYGPNCIAADLFGNAYLAGGFYPDTFVVGLDTLMPSSGFYNMFVAKYRCDNAVSINELNQRAEVSVYPNPSGGMFTLHTTAPEGEISVFNVLGEVVFQSTINSSTSTIDLSTRASGIYFANVVSGSTVYSTKLIKQ